MAISDLQEQSTLYIQWQNVLSSVDNIVSACQSANDLMTTIQSLEIYGTYASSDETDYMTNMMSMITSFIDGLPTQPS